MRKDEKYDVYAAKAAKDNYMEISISRDGVLEKKNSNKYMFNCGNGSLSGVNLNVM